MNRSHVLLGGLLIAQIALLVIFRSPFSGAAPLEARSLLPGLEGQTPARIEIGNGDGETVTLARGEGGWAVADADDYPADGGSIEQLVGKLADLEVRRPVVTSARYHDALGVATDEHEGRVRIWMDGDNGPRFELLVGTSSNYRVTHVRVAGDDRVYEAHGISPYDLRADAEAWISKRFVDVPEEDVRSLKLTNAHGTLELKRDGEGFELVSPQRTDVRLDDDEVSAWVRSLAQFWVSRPGGRLDGPAQGLDEPVASFELGYVVDDEQRTVTVSIGAEVADEEGKRFAARSGFDHVAILDSWEAEKVTEKKLEDLTVDEDEG